MSPSEPAAVFALGSGRPLVERICRHLGIVPGRLEEHEFEDGEHKVRPVDDVRGRDVYVVESLYGEDTRSVNDKLVRTLFFLASLRDAGTDSVTAIAPYLCYARQDLRTQPREPVTTRYVATLFEAVGTDRMVTLDVHTPAAYQNAFRIPAEHLTGAPLLVAAIAPLVGDRAAVVVSPDAGGVKRAERFRRALEQRLDRPVGFAFVQKFREEGVVRRGTLVGPVKGHVAVVLDDLVSSGATLVRAAAACREQGASAVYAAVTHGVFSADASALLRGSEIERIVVLDTIPPNRLDPDLLRSRVEVVDCAPLLAAAIHGLHTNGAMVE